VYASPRSSPSATQHLLPGGRYPLPGPVFHRLDRASFAWRTRNVFAHSPEVVSFDTPEIREQCLKIKALESYRLVSGLGITGLPKTPSVSRSQFMASYLCIYFALSKYEVSQLTKRVADLREAGRKLEKLSESLRSGDYSGVDFDYFGSHDLRIP